MKRKIKPVSTLLWLARGLFVLFLVGISIGPLLWLFASSFKTNSEIISATAGFPTGLHIKNYFKAFEIAPIVTLFMNSVVVAVLGTLLNLATASLAAYAISRFQFRLKGVLKIMLTSILFIPCAALLQPLYMTVKTLGLYDNRLGLVIVYAGLGLATSFYIMLSYYLTIPTALEEAAYIDGCGPIKAFSKIIVPLSVPAYATAAVLQFLLCWNEFQFALTLTTGNKSRTLPIALYYFTSQFASDYGAMFAATVIVAVPSILIFLLLQKYVISGLSSGAVKG